MSVKDNVLVAALFSRRIPSIKEAEKETERVLKLVGLQNKSDMIANDLTSPEKKLLELARSLVTKPKLLLLDEIVAGMPPSDIDNIMSLVVQVAKEEKISVVAMVEHIIRTVKYANRAIFLHQGQILLDSSPDDVLNSDLVRNIYLGEVEHA
jgi:branched-chain amino acid transport system ATP-binding protein